MSATLRSLAAALTTTICVASASAQSPQPSPAFLSEPPAGGMSASTLVGVDVVGMDHERLGRTEDVVVDAEGKVRAVVLGIGGFLGIGEKRVALPFDQFVWVPRDGVSDARSRSTTEPGNAPSDKAAATAGPSTMPGAQVSNDVLASVDEKRGGSVNDATGSVTAKDQPRGRATVPVTAASNGLVRAEVRLTKAMLQAAPAYSRPAEATR